MVLMELLGMGSFVVGAIGVIYAIKQYRLNKKLKKDKEELKLKLNQYTTYIGEVNVTINELPPSEEEIKKISKKHFFIKEPLIKEEIAIFSPGNRFDKLMARLKNLISEQDKDILLSASAILKVDAEGKGNLASQMFKSFMQRYGHIKPEKRAIRIYNNLNSKSFEDNLLPYLDELEIYLPKNDSNIKKLFLEYYENLLKFVVNRIWIVEFSNYDTIKQEVENRFKEFTSLKVLYLFARHPLRIDVAELVCKYFIKKNKGKFKWESKERKVLGKIAKDFKIIKVS